MYVLEIFIMKILPKQVIVETIWKIIIQLSNITKKVTWKLIFFQYCYRRVECSHIEVSIHYIKNDMRDKLNHC